MKLKLFKSLLILFIVVLVFTSSACDVRYEELPQTSENFDQAFVDSFFENYHYFDPHLAYYTASPWEIKIEEMDESVTHRREGNYYLSVIDGVDKNHFVSCTAHDIVFMPGGNTYKTYIYQHINAPKPLKDWTIDSISLIRFPYSHADHVEAVGSESAKSSAEAYMERKFGEIDALATFEADEFSNSFEALKTAYENQSVKLIQEGYPIATKITKIVDDSPYHKYYYVLLIHFKEYDNLVWFTHLYESKTESDVLYFDNTFIQIREDRASHEEFYERIEACVPIDSELSAKLLEVIKQDMES